MKITYCIAIYICCFSCTGINPNMGKVSIAYEDNRGRIITSNSLTYLDDSDRYDFYPTTSKDVIIGGSFAGMPTTVDVLKLGVRGVIAHEAGVGKNRKGIEGLEIAEKIGIPAAAVATHSAKISDGKSVANGTISHMNRSAEILGVKKGMKALDAAKLMLNADKGIALSQDDYSFDEQIKMVQNTDITNVFTVWSIGLVKDPHPNDIYCVASHAGIAMADYAIPVSPKAIFANDAGIAKDSSGVAGLKKLDRKHIAGIGVEAMSAEIGNPTSTYQQGVVSVINETAKTQGVVVGMTVKKAIKILIMN